MTDRTKKRIRSLSGVILSASLALSGICLISACLSIYFAGGEDPYSPATVAAAYRPIAWALWLSIGLAVVCLALRLFLPEQEKLIAQVSRDKVIARLRRQTDDQPTLQLADALAARRKTEERISLLLAAAGLLGILLYGLDGNHFHDQDINGSVIRAMWVVLPCAGIPFLWAVFAAYHANKLRKQEQELLRTAPKAASPLPAETPQPKPCFCWVRWALLSIGIGILIYGFITGGTLDVLTKAINICTECVGLG